jgi:ATP-dependent Clp protease ATP-binding subunit ClpB
MPDDLRLKKSPHAHGGAQPGLSPTFKITDAAREQLAREGYDRAYGARPLKRTIQRRVLDALSMRILEGEFVDGDTATVDALAEGLRFEKQPAVAA